MSNIYFLSDIDVNFARKRGSKDKKKRKINKYLIGGLAAAGTLALITGGNKIKNVIENRQLKKQFDKTVNPAIDNFKEELRKNREEFNNNIQKVVENKKQENKELFDYIENLDINSTINKLEKRSKLSQQGNLSSRGIKGSTIKETKDLKSDIIKRRRKEIYDQYNRNVRGMRVNEPKRVDNLINNLGKRGTNLTSRQRRKYNSVIKGLANKARNNRTLVMGEYSKNNTIVNFARKQGSKDKVKRMSRLGAGLRIGLMSTIGGLSGAAIGNVASRMGSIPLIKEYPKQYNKQVALGTLAGAGLMGLGTTIASYKEHKKSKYSPIGKKKWRDYPVEPRMYGIPVEKLSLIKGLDQQ